ncbi:MAG: histidine phosphatase family protein [Rhabdochlamydiaceae bacterium]
MSIETSVDSVDFVCMRHGESVWNAQHRLQGQSPDPTNRLTDEGVEQVKASALKLKPQLAGREVMIWASPLPRAQQTAELIAEIFEYKQPIRFDKRLMEAYHGSFEGKNDTDPGYHDHPHYAARKEIKDPSIKFNTPFGPPEDKAESPIKVYTRVKEFFDEIAAQYPNHLHIIATHGGPINHTYKVCTGDYGPGERAANGEVIQFKYILEDKTVQTTCL